MAVSEGTLALAIEIHKELAAIVAPATPDTIRASSVFRNLTLLAIFTFGIVCLILTFYPVLMRLPDGVRFVEFLQIVGAAGLGSAFYALYTAHGYIKASTFDPKYNDVYLLRFGMGLIAGVILAKFFQEFARTDAEATTVTIGTLTLALLGGFAAEVVAQILKRGSETLVTLVTGSGKDKAEADAQRSLAGRLSALSSQLHEALEGDDPERIKEIVRRLIKDTLRPT